MDKPGAAKITIRKFYRPSGASAQLKGVVPDIIPAQCRELHGRWGILDNALAWDTISPASFQKANRITPYLPGCPSAPRRVSPPTAILITCAGHPAVPEGAGGRRSP